MIGAVKKKTVKRFIPSFATIAARWHWRATLRIRFVIAGEYFAPVRPKNKFPKCGQGAGFPLATCEFSHP